MQRRARMTPTSLSTPPLPSTTGVYSTRLFDAARKIAQILASAEMVGEISPLRSKYPGTGVWSAYRSERNSVAVAFIASVSCTAYGVPRQQLEEGVSRWLFGTLLTARYSGSSETKYEEDLGRVRDPSKADPTAFVQTLDDMLSDVLTNDYWNQTLVSALDTQRGRAPAALGFRAAQVILGGKALFSDQPLQNLLAAPGGGGRAASEMHHLFPKAWLHDHGITERKKVNQVANLADVGWYDNGLMGSQSPAKYVPRLRAKFDNDQWGRMCAEHALPPRYASNVLLPRDREN